MENMEELPRGSRDCWGAFGRGRVGAGDVCGEGEGDGVRGVAGRMGTGVSFGSGEGLMVRMEEREGGCVAEACWDGCARITVVLYSEKLDLASSSGWCPVDSWSYGK